MQASEVALLGAFGIAGYLIGKNKDKPQPVGYPIYVDLPGQRPSGDLVDVINQAQAAGDPVNVYGVAVSGANAEENAMAIYQILRQKYGGEWHVYYQNGMYNVLPQPRVLTILAEGGNVGTLIM